MIICESIWQRKIFPYLDAKDVSSVSCVNKAIRKIANEAILHTLHFSSCKPMVFVLGKRLRQELELAADVLCKSSLQERGLYKKRLRDQDLLLPVLEDVAKSQENRRIKHIQKLSVNSNMTRQMRSLTKNATCLLKEGFGYEAMTSLESIKNQNRKKAFSEVFRALIQDKKIVGAVQLVYQMNSMLRNEALRSLISVLNVHWKIYELKDLLLAVESIESFSSVSSSSPLLNENEGEEVSADFYKKAMQILNKWNVLDTTSEIHATFFEDALKSLKKLNQAQFIVSAVAPFPLIRQSILLNLKNPLYIALVLSVCRQFVFTEETKAELDNTYKSFFPENEDHGMFFRMNELISNIDIKPNRCMIQIVNQVIWGLKADGRESEKTYIEDLEKFKTL